MLFTELEHDGGPGWVGEIGGLLKMCWLKKCLGRQLSTQVWISFERQEMEMKA
jgi:hypothetical protein